MITLDQLEEMKKSAEKVIAENEGSGYAAITTIPCEVLLELINLIKN